MVEIISGFWIVMCEIFSSKRYNKYINKIYKPPAKFMRDEGFHINIYHPFTILKYLIFCIVLFPWFRMFKKRNYLN